MVSPFEIRILEIKVEKANSKGRNIFNDPAWIPLPLGKTREKILTLNQVFSIYQYFRQRTLLGISINLRGNMMLNEGREKLQ